MSAIAWEDLSDVGISQGAVAGVGVARLGRPDGHGVVEDGAEDQVEEAAVPGRPRVRRCVIAASSGVSLR